jgi:hypothetical protein
MVRAADDNATLRQEVQQLPLELTELRALVQRRGQAAACWRRRGSDRRRHLLADPIDIANERAFSKLSLGCTGSATRRQHRSKWVNSAPAHTPRASQASLRQRRIRALRLKRSERRLPEGARCLGTTFVVTSRIRSAALGRRFQSRGCRPKVGSSSAVDRTAVAPRESDFEQGHKTASDGFGEWARPSDRRLITAEPADRAR